MDFIVGALDSIGYVTVLCQRKSRWLLCYHKERHTWEFPGGHVEKNELPLTAAKRELYEETGAKSFDIYPLWDYNVFNSDGTLHNNGRFYFANIKKFGALPKEFEMERIGFFDELPTEVTYNREDMINLLKKAQKSMSAFYR